MICNDKGDRLACELPDISLSSQHYFLPDAANSKTAMKTLLAQRCNCVSMRPFLRLLAPAAALSRCALPRAFAVTYHPSTRLRPALLRRFASVPHAGAAFDSAVNDLPYADFLRVPESDVLMDARHTKRQVGSATHFLCVA
jgi:hypothetical protein